MMAMGIPVNAKQPGALVKEGEGPALEFKRSRCRRRIHRAWAIPHEDADMRLLPPGGC